jgi:hypothetical protein
MVEIVQDFLPASVPPHESKAIAARHVPRLAKFLRPTVKGQWFAGGYILTGFRRGQVRNHLRGGIPHDFPAVEAGV